MKKDPSIIKQTVISCLLIAISQTAFSASNKSKQPQVILKVPVELKNMTPLKRKIVCAIYAPNNVQFNMLAGAEGYIKQASGDISEIVTIPFDSSSIDNTQKGKNIDLRKADNYSCWLASRSPSDKLLGIDETKKNKTQISGSMPSYPSTKSKKKKQSN